jgi:hypothetical protein
MIVTYTIAMSADCAKAALVNENSAPSNNNRYSD